MLPIINLDNENYPEIFEKSRKMIPKVFPEWTDYNEHDPGITLLELFSWLKEMQQFYIDQIGEENYRMFLKLLGVRPERKKPAVSLLEVFQYEKTEKVFLRGMKFRAGNMTFETTQMETLEDNKISGCMVHTGGNDIFYNEEMINSKSAMNIPIFGMEMKEGDYFDIYFEKPFEKNVVHKIYMEMEDDYDVKRNDFGSDFCPLADLEWQYFSDDAFRICEDTGDGTRGLLASGAWSFMLRNDMTEKDGKYVLRIVLRHSEYDVVPRIKKISFNIFPIRQTDTKIDYVIAKPDKKNRVFIDADLCARDHSFLRVFRMEKEKMMELERFSAEKKRTGTTVTLFEECEKVMIVYGDEELNALKRFEAYGFPEQIFQIHNDEILYDGFEIMVYENIDGCYHLWEKTEDFHASGKEDRHYVFDEDTGTLRFGDCEHGMAPEGRVEIIRYITSAGVKGNIKKSRIEQIWDGNNSIIATNCYDISSGQSRETIEEAFERFLIDQGKIERCVTLEDYERIVKDTPGLRIRKVKAITGFDKHNQDETTIVVQPFSREKEARLSKAYYRNIYQNLEKKRLIGTRVRIMSPEYYGASIFIEASVLPYYTDAKKMIEEAVLEYFENVVSAFGSPIIYSDIFGRVDALRCVSRIRSLSIDLQGKDVMYTKNENIIIPQNGLTFVKAIECEITSAEY